MPSGCWEWIGARNDGGYGQKSVDGKLIYTHRITWSLLRGPIPKGKHVLHVCDNPPCCNPDHLFLGTHAENMADMSKKGRANNAGHNGTRHGRSKLTAEMVRAIIRLYTADKTAWSQRRLARRFCVNQTAIARLLRGETYPGLNAGKITLHQPPRLTKDAVIEVVSLRKADPALWSHSRLADRFGVHERTIGKLLQGKTHRRFAVEAET